MTEEELIRVCEANIHALQRHAKSQSMDDAEYIQIIRVLIETTETLLAEFKQPKAKIEAAAWKLMELAKTLYVRFSLEQNPEIANKEDLAQESDELFDYVYFHGAYPE